ncbi:MAG TPA: hypothetical protein VD861_12320 [Pyrinomonadaceae bacterium]|nr:hypothetical protein [Pyrinomonadaceae bacterium]
MLRSVGRGAFPAALLFLLAALAGPGRVLACSCVHPTTCEAYSRADAVFVGTVESFTERKEYEDFEGGRIRFAFQVSRLRVEESFTDLNGAAEVVVETEVSSNCGFRLAQGARYLVYGQRLKETGRFGAGTCTRTALAENAAEDLAYLRSATREASGATISGRVVYDDGAAVGDEIVDANVEPLGVTTAVLEGGGRRREARIGPEGFYSFYDVAAGKYKLYVSLPDGLTDFKRLSPDIADGSDEKDQREIAITGRGCFHRHFAVKDNGRISGRVLDEDGGPAAHVTVSLIHFTLTGKVREPGDDFFDNLTSRTDEAGNYNFMGLRPGGYLIGVRVGKRISGDGPEAAYPQTYYPGVPARKQAVVVALGKGGSVAGHNFQLPPRFAERRVTGRAVWGDGRPAANVQVRFAARTPDRKRLGVTYLDTDADGKFSFVAYEGTAYLVGAFIREGVENGPRYAREVEVAPRGQVRSLRLTLNQQGTSPRDFTKFQQ